MPGRWEPSVVRRKMAVLYNLKNPVGVCFGVEPDDSLSSFLHSFEFPLVGMLTARNALQFGGRLVEEELRLGTTEVWSDMESGSGVQSLRDPQFLAGFLHAVADVISKDELIIYVYSELPHICCWFEFLMITHVSFTSLSHF